MLVSNPFITHSTTYLSEETRRKYEGKIKITITDLNLALQEKDSSVLQYLNSLEKFWTDYYTLRRLTLYDFIKNKKIEVEDIVYN